jgi:hypothetical protein
MALMDTAPLSPSYGTVTNLPLCLLNWAPEASDAKNRADGRCGVGLRLILTPFLKRQKPMDLRRLFCLFAHGTKATPLLWNKEG